MYFDDMKLGMTVNVAPAVIDKDKMLEFAKEYDDVPLHTDENMLKLRRSESLLLLVLCLSWLYGLSILRWIFSEMNFLLENQLRSNG